MPRLLLPSVLVLLTLASAACGAGTAATPAPRTATPMPQGSALSNQARASGARTVATDIANFILASLEVGVGTTVTWTNRDSAPHTATAGSPGSASGVWNSGTLQQGQSFSFTFEQAGQFAYYCAVHSSMTATVTVSGAAAAPSPTATPAPTLAPTPTPRPAATPAPRGQMPEYSDDYDYY